LKCEYCGSEFVPSHFHPGTCNECGAPKPDSELEQALRPYEGGPLYTGMYCVSTCSPIMWTDMAFTYK